LAAALSLDRRLGLRVFPRPPGRGAARRRARPRSHARAFPHPRAAGARAGDSAVQARHPVEHAGCNADRLWNRGGKALMAGSEDDVVLELARHYRFQWEPAQNAFVLLYPEGMVKLGGSAGEILKRVDGSSPVSAIVADLERAFPGVDLRRDVTEFLAHAREKGWIRVRSA